MTKEWLKNLVIGDSVIVSCLSDDEIYIVKRLTKTQIILEGTHEKYKRDSGFEIGSYYGSNPSYLKEATPEKTKIIKEKNKRTKLIRALKEIEWREYKTNDLQNVLNFISGFKKNERN